MANSRTDADYEIDAVTKARLIIECLVEEEPITEKAIVKKTGFKKDMVMRTLRTFRLGGWAVRNDTTLEWRVGPRLVRLATDVTNSKQSRNWTTDPKILRARNF